MSNRSIPLPDGEVDGAYEITDADLAETESDVDDTAQGDVEEGDQ